MIVWVHSGECKKLKVPKIISELGMDFSLAEHSCSMNLLGANPDYSESVQAACIDSGQQTL